MKKTLFSKGLYIEGLRRLRVFGFVALAVMLVVQLAIPLMGYFNYVNAMEHMTDIESYPPDTMKMDLVLISIPLAMALVTPIMVLMLFSIFNKRSSSDFYHALPYTRVCMYLSSMAAVFTWVLGMCIIAGSAGIISLLTMPKIYTIVFDGWLELILSYLSFMIFTAGVFSLGVSLSGTMFSNIAVSAVIMIMPRFIITVISYMVGDGAEFLALEYLPFFNPETNVVVGTLYNLFFMGDIPNYFKNVWCDVYTIVLGLIYLAASLFFFVRRKSEVATQPALTRGVQAAVRIVITLCVSIFAVILVIEGEVAAAIIISLISAIVYFAYELVTTHRWKNCLRALPGLAIVLGLSIVCGALMLGIPKIAEQYRPEADDIDSVRFMYEGRRDHWFGKGTDEVEFTDSEIKKIVADTVCENMEARENRKYTGYGGYYSDSTFVYHENESYVTRTVAIKDGIFTRYRKVTFKSSDHDEILRSFEEHEEYVRVCKTLPKPAKDTMYFGYSVQDGADQSFYDKVFECLQKEIYELPFEDWYKVAQSYGEGMMPSFEISYYADTYEDIHVNLYIPAEYFPNTYGMLLTTNNLGYKERLEMAKEMFEELEESDVEGFDYLSFNMQVCIPDGEGGFEVYNADSYYSRHDKTSKWENDPYREGYLAIMENALKTDEKPSLENGFVFFDFNIERSLETEEFEKYDYDEDVEYLYSTKGIYETIFLPLPDNFDPNAYGFYVIVEELKGDSEIYYEYID